MQDLKLGFKMYSDEIGTHDTEGVDFFNHKLFSYPELLFRCIDNQNIYWTTWFDVLFNEKCPFYTIACQRLYLYLQSLSDENTITYHKQTII